MKDANIQVSKDKLLLDIDVIYPFLKNSYWAKDRTFSQIEKSIENSICFGLYQEQNQIGFARVITDRATFAYIADVFVVESKRGLGFSKILMRSILKDLELSDVKNWYLITRDAHGLYEKFDFEVYNKPGFSVMTIPRSKG